MKNGTNTEETCFGSALTNWSHNSCAHHCKKQTTGFTFYKSPTTPISRRKKATHLQIMKNRTIFEVIQSRICK